MYISQKVTPGIDWFWVGAILQGGLVRGLGARVSGLLLRTLTLVTRLGIYIYTI